MANAYFSNVFKVLKATFECYFKFIKNLFVYNRSTVFVEPNSNRCVKLTSVIRYVKLMCESQSAVLNRLKTKNVRGIQK
jgi:hypothetical protein